MWIWKPLGYVWFLENARERKFGGKKKVKEMNINFFTCLVIHGKFKGKKKEFIFFCLVNHKKKSMKNGRKTKSIICLR